MSKPSSALRVLTPDARPRPPVPRWALLSIAVAFLAQGAYSVVRASLVEVVAVLATAAALVGGCALASWLEERLYLATTRGPVVLRLLFHAALAVVAFPALLLAGAFAQEGPDLFGLGEWLVALGAIAGFWAAGAASGSLPIVVIDAVVSAFVQGFRARIQLAILSLLALGVVLAVAVATAAVALLEAARDRTIDLSAIRVDGKPMPLEQAQPWIDAALEQPSLVVLGLTIAAALVALPAVMSATGKLAEAVLERFHPLSVAFDLVGAGARDVRVEEKGSRDFVALVKRFNQMVASLGLAERMERAFGVYVSAHVLERIRAQHGEAALPASLREASVFFADIRGFTSMSERLPAADVVAVLNRYFERVVAVIDEHDGYLNKFIGDAVVVVFNGPVDQPDHAERAVRCAIALQDAVEAMNASGAFPEIGRLDIGVGVSTGPMVCGNVGSSKQMEYTVIGDTVNLSARLTGQAKPGEVWVSEATARALPADLPTTAMESITVKGKALPVVPHRVWPHPPHLASVRMKAMTPSI